MELKVPGSVFTGAGLGVGVAVGAGVTDGTGVAVGAGVAVGTGVVVGAGVVPVPPLNQLFKIGSASLPRGL